MMDNGFTHGLRSAIQSCGRITVKVTIVSEEKRTQLIVWEFSETNGDSRCRFLKEGKSANISTGG
jgi:hypothetical protein